MEGHDWFPYIDVGVLDGDSALWNEDSRSTHWGRD